MDKLIVAGDPTIDWAVKVEEEDPHPEERITFQTRAYWHRGGALLLGALINAAAGIEPTNLADVSTNGDALSPLRADVNHTYNTFQKYDSKIEDYPSWAGQDTSGKLRIQKFLGMEPANKLSPQVDTAIEPPRIIAIDDAGFRFGENENSELKSRIRTEQSSPWVVYRLSGKALSCSKFWKSITVQSPNFIIPIISAWDLRRAGAAVSIDQSWERSSQDVIAEVERNNAIGATLRRCRYVIVSFGPTGALLIDTHGRSHRLIFHRRFMPRSWSWKYENRYGRMFGYGQIMTACIVTALAQCRNLEAISDDSLLDRIDSAMKRGLESSWRAYASGFRSDDGKHNIEFPTDCVKEVTGSKEAAVSKCEFGQCDLQERSADRQGQMWSILNLHLQGKNPCEEAIQIARYGIEGPEKPDQDAKTALVGVPYARFGKLITVDRQEIEGLRSLRRLLSGYWEDLRKTTPVSIAVFGAPGDGKSFAVQQVVDELLDEKERRERLEFNLTQFDTPSDLAEAFHQVRDRGLRQEKAPVVFFDEFDTTLDGEELGWLRHFLAPMQDGYFLQKNIRHPIGRAIFVFAGGINSTFEEFAEYVKGLDYKNSKGQDFASRLSGNLNIASLNPRNGDPLREPQTLIHRALVIHEALKGERIEPEDLDDDVLCAFLTVSTYRYGARSMKTLIDMSDLHHGGKFSQANLPPLHQLNLQVDGDEFLRKAGECIR